VWGDSQVILEKNKSIRTVVNKSASIDTVYRFFQMELIAGVEDYTTTVKESNCSFRMEYNKVRVILVVDHG
jgi:tRNA (guanine37-N1)-methyltransferase